MPQVLKIDKTGYQRFAVAFYLFFTVIVGAACIVMGEGRFFYPLDDTYIHLSVAETILRGGYGVNFPEHSSPSSSILYPWLLALSLTLGLGDYGPLVIGVVTAALTVRMVAWFWWDISVQQGSSRSVGVALVAVPLLVFCGNFVGLSLTGMEHSLHVLCSVLIVIGLTRLQRGTPVPAILIIGLICAPLIRFEGAALTLFGILALLWQGKRMAALAVVTTLGAVGAAYGMYMQSIGLSLLPSSVLSKSQVSAAMFDSDTPGAISAILSGLKQSFETQWGPIFIAAILLATGALVRDAKHGNRQGVLVAGAVVSTLAAHVLFGRYGWLSRYEVYAVVVMVLGVPYLFSKQFKQATAYNALRGYVLLGVWAAISLGYIVTTLITPNASKNVYVQQYQLHRFTTELFDFPVAVNDLGWTSYRNDTYVLDLWGLGSETARRLIRRAGMTPEAIAALSDAKNIKYALLYESWFNYNVPSAWCRIGVLETDMVTAGDSRTSLFLIDASLAGEMADATEAFAAGLPDGAAFHPSDCTDRDLPDQ